MSEADRGGGGEAGGGGAHCKAPENAVQTVISVWLGSLCPEWPDTVVLQPAI